MGLRIAMYLHRITVLPALVTAAILVLLFSLHSGAGEGIDCDIQRGPCVHDARNGMRIEFDIAPRPVTAMSELTFIVTLKKNGVPLTDAVVSLDLSMPGMFMGKNRPLLSHEGQGTYRGKGVITRCASGRKIWKAAVAVERAGQTTDAAFVVEVK